MLHTYFKSPHISLYYDSELRLGKAVWKGNVKGAELREAVLLCLYLIDRYSLKRWLADDRKMKGMDPADVQWLEEVFLPGILAGSVARIARLPSEYVEHTQAIELMKEKKGDSDARLLIHDFECEEEAMRWLLEDAPNIR